MFSSDYFKATVQEQKAQLGLRRIAAQDDVVSFEVQEESQEDADNGAEESKRSGPPDQHD